MSEEIKQDLDQVLEDLKDELADKPQGYVTEISVAERLFPEMEPRESRCSCSTPKKARPRSEGYRDHYRGKKVRVVCGRARRSHRGCPFLGGGTGGKQRPHRGRSG